MSYYQLSVKGAKLENQQVANEIQKLADDISLTDFLVVLLQLNLDTSLLLKRCRLFMQSPGAVIQEEEGIAPLINVYVNTRQLVGSAGTYYALKILLSVINTTVSQSETAAQSVAHQKYAFGAFSAFRSIIPEDLYDNPVILFMMNIQYPLMHQVIEQCALIWKLSSP